jgi:hypothetical protein
MRQLLLAALALTACGRRDIAHDAQPTDTSASSTAAVVDTAAKPQTMTPVPERLLGTWSAKGYDAGSTRAQPFTMTWSRSPDGGLGGVISFKGGEKYNVNVVSSGDQTIVYESAPHQSPTLKGEVVTRTTARIVGDSLVGTYEAKATKGGKVLRGRFTANRGTAP